VKETKDNVGNALENENIKISPEEIEEVLKEKEAKIMFSLQEKLLAKSVWK